MLPQCKELVCPKQLTYIKFKTWHVSLYHSTLEYLNLALNLAILVAIITTAGCIKMVNESLLRKKMKIMNFNVIHNCSAP